MSSLQLLFKVVLVKNVKKTKSWVECVPHLWEIDGILWWPKKNLSQLQRDPHSLPDKRTWKKYTNVKVKCSFKTFVEANEKVNSIIIASNESDVNECSSRNYRAIKRAHVLKKRGTAAVSDYSSMIQKTKNIVQKPTLFEFPGNSSDILEKAIENVQQTPDPQPSTPTADFQPCASKQNENQTFDLSPFRTLNEIEMESFQKEIKFADHLLQNTEQLMQQNHVEVFASTQSNQNADINFRQGIPITTTSGETCFFDFASVLNLLQDNPDFLKYVHNQQFMELKADNEEMKKEISSLKIVQMKMLNMLAKYSTNIESFFKQMGTQSVSDANADMEVLMLKKMVFVDLKDFHSGIETPDDMKNFENLITTNDEVKLNYMKYFFDKYDLDGKNCGKTVAYKTIDALVLPQLYIHYTWKGRTYKNVTSAALCKHEHFIGLIFAIAKLGDKDVKMKQVLEALETRCKNKTQNAERFNEDGTRRTEHCTRKRSSIKTKDVPLKISRKETSLDDVDVSSNFTRKSPDNSSTDE